MELPEETRKEIGHQFKASDDVASLPTQNMFRKCTFRDADCTDPKFGSTSNTHSLQYLYYTN